MTRSQRFKTIVNLANTKERQTAILFAQKQKVLAEFEKKRALLETYRKEYSDKISSDKDQSFSGSWLREQQSFLIQIDEGIKMLTEQIQIQRQSNNHERAQWLQAKQQADAMENVLQKITRLENRIHDNRLQHELDDLSTRNHR